MDLLAAILFGSITIKAIEAQGITDKKVLTKLCSYAGLIAAFFLAIIYAALAYTGALSINVSVLSPMVQLCSAKSAPITWASAVRLSWP